MSTYSLDLLARRGAIAGITAYQHYLSPRKGFACPHRVLHQGASCADYIKGAFQQQSFVDAVKVAPQRFRACQLAATTLQSQSLSRQEGGCIVIPCCIPI